MAITTRAALKAQFKTGAVPAAQDFFNLIDSILTKRDDAFFGKWQPGISYRTGDVVIYKKALYCCVPDGEDPCGCEGEPTATTETVPPGEYCSVLPPDEDPQHWQLLKIDMEDEDWEIIRAEQEGAEDIMYAKVFGRIGMGTDNPAARVHIHDDDRYSDYLFNLNDDPNPTFQMQRSGENPAMLSQSLDGTNATFRTNAAGFLFQGTGITPTDATPVTGAIEPMPVYITFPDHDASVGIGTAQPGAALDVQSRNRARVLVCPHGQDATAVVSVYKDPYAQESYLSLATTGDAATISTNTTEGFYFKAGDERSTGYGANAGEGIKTLVSIRKEGRVGVGTEQPRAHLEVTDNESGSMSVSFEKVNPAFCMVNLRNKPNYFTIGADNDLGIFVTDSNGGYVFRRGGNYGENNNETNINQGDDLVSIKANGRVGIGMDPEEYELELYGAARMFSLYLDTNTRRVQGAKPIDAVLNKVMKLNPVRFRWNPKQTNLPDNVDQIGFLAHEVADWFPELVRTHQDRTKSVAYANMVAVLTKAIQEQQAHIDDLEKRLARLEGRGGMAS